MTADRRASLMTEGFDCITTMRVGVVYFVWRVDMDVEFDRELRLVEETVLRLTTAGIADPATIAQLMGLTDDRIVPRCIVDLLSKGLLSRRDGQMVLSLQGKEALTKALTRETRTYEDLEIRHDPYRNELQWEFNEQEHKRERLAADGMRGLPSPPGLKQSDMEERYRDVQVLVDKEGLPFDKENNDKTKGPAKRQCEVVRVRPVKSYEVYLEGTLEAWHRERTDEWQWRLLRGDGEESTISEKLHEMETGGAVIIPLDEKKELTISAAGETVHAAAEIVQGTSQPAILQTQEHRQALQEAIMTAKKELVVISPWLRTDAVDQELIDWFRTAMDKNKDLRITIGYGIEGDAKRQRDQTVRDQREALDRLNRISTGYRGRLRVVDIGNTHEKMVICDDRYAIITSFNWLSFNPRPGRGIRRETGTRVTDPTVVAQIKSKLLTILR